MNSWVHLWSELVDKQVCCSSWLIAALADAWVVKVGRWVIVGAQILLMSNG